MQEKEQSISLNDIFRVLWKNIILFVAITVCMTIIGAVYTFAVAKPTYKSEASICVSLNQPNQPTETDYTNSLRAVVTVSDAITQNVILTPVAEEYSISVKDLKNKIKVTNKSNSMVVTIAVTDADAEKAEHLAQAIVERCIDESHSVTTAGSVGVFSRFAQDSITVFSNAERGVYSSPNKKLYLLVSFVLGAVLSCVVIFIKEFMSNKYRTRVEIENANTDRILGVFPDDRDKEKCNKKYTKEVQLLTPSIRSFEPYNKLLTNIKYSNLEHPYKSILFTSTISDELKSTTISNLAFCMAHNGKKVIILDLDIRKSVLHRTYNVEKTNGIVDYCEGICTIEDIIKHSSYGVDVITSGKDVVNPVAILETTRLKELIQTLKEQYDYVLVDTPPSLACSDAQIISSYVDGVIYNVALSKAKKKDITDCIKSLKLAGANIIGLNVTKAENSKHDVYYYYGQDN